jgi:hypothetical protein
MQRLPRSSQENLQLTDQDSISVYNGKLTTKCIAIQVEKLKKAFPMLTAGFYEILTDRIRDLKFSDARLTDSVNNLIDTFTYPHPTVADIISWDKRVKLFTYRQLVDMVNESGPSVWDEYKAIQVPGIKTRVYASILDIEQYNLKLI